MDKTKAVNIHKSLPFFMAQLSLKSYNVELNLPVVGGF